MANCLFEFGPRAPDFGEDGFGGGGAFTMNPDGTGGTVDVEDDGGGAGCAAPAHGRTLVPDRDRPNGELAVEDSYKQLLLASRRSARVGTRRAVVRSSGCRGIAVVELFGDPDLDE